MCACVKGVVLALHLPPSRGAVRDSLARALGWPRDAAAFAPVSSVTLPRTDRERLRSHVARPSPLPSSNTRANVAPASLHPPGNSRARLASRCRRICASLVRDTATDRSRAISLARRAPVTSPIIQHTGECPARLAAPARQHHDPSASPAASEPPYIRPCALQVRPPTLCEVAMPPHSRQSRP